MRIDNFYIAVETEVIYECVHSVTLAFRVGDGPICIMTVDGDRMTFNIERFISDLLSLTDREVRWTHQGREPETGLDCIGYPRWAITLQTTLPAALEDEFRAYHKTPDGARLLRVMQQWLIEVPAGEAQRGDILLLYHKRNPQHVAVLVEPGFVVEAVTFPGSGIGKVLKQKLDPRRRIAACFRIPEFA